MKFEVYFFDQMNGKYRSFVFDFLDEARRFAKSCRSWALPMKQPYILRKAV